MFIVVKKVNKVLAILGKEIRNKIENIYCTNPCNTFFSTVCLVRVPQPQERIYKTFLVLIRMIGGV